MAVTSFLLNAVHVLLAAVWLGAMAYSLAVVQPRAERLLGEQRYEEFAAVLASGARWPVLALCAGLGLSGGGLVAVVLADRAPTTGWWVLVGAKSVVLIVAMVVFWYVSWRLWPQRIFAVPDEVPALRRAFWRAAATLLALVVTEFVLGAAAQAVT